ncbi:hypothetical protein SDC9_91615 [bioreactor metagenome]|uniref:Uncharacterized protein n=1 Tax=bioreactor metagenome TaxID=1076179 RepID=A0A645A261_9ZZZZ
MVEQGVLAAGFGILRAMQHHAENAAVECVVVAVGMPVDRLVGIGNEIAAYAAAFVAGRGDSAHEGAGPGRCGEFPVPRIALGPRDCGRLPVAGRTGCGG